MKFTKEQIEIAIAILNTQGLNGEDVISIKDLITNLDSLLKSDRSKIILEVEYDTDVMKYSWVGTVIGSILSKHPGDFKIKELSGSQKFTRQDMEDLARWVEGKDDKDKDRFKNIVDNFMRDRISKRSKK